MNETEIPRGDYDSPAPCWIPAEFDDKPARPRIKCNCGKICVISLHHVHADGLVTRSFFDSPADSFVENGVTYSHSPGCGWHVWLKLRDYDQGDFPPRP